MPQTRGANGQGLVSDGSGGVNWASAVGSTETMAESFAAAGTQSDNIITTQPTSAQATLFIRQGVAAPSTVFEAQDENGLPTVRIGNAGVTTNQLTTEKVIIGVAGQSYTLPLVRAVSANQRPVSTGPDGVVEWQGRSYANVYFVENVTLTPLPVQNQFEIIRGARLGTFAADFTLNPGPAEQQLLVYRGSQPKVFQVIQTLTGEAESTLEAYTQAIFKNGQLMRASQVSTILDNGKNFPRSATSVSIVQLENGDTLGGFIKNTSGVSGAILSGYQLVVTEV
jgi:hypothetical protein